VIKNGRRLGDVLGCDLYVTGSGSRAASQRRPGHETDRGYPPCTCRDVKAMGTHGEGDLGYDREICGGLGRKAVACRWDGRAVCCLAIYRNPEVDGMEVKEICGSVSLLDQLGLGLCAHRLVCGRLSWRHVEVGCGGRTPS
ncbi:hypothetical protein GQ607_002333, partial [Colletotrichum asianum]